MTEIKIDSRQILGENLLLKSKMAVSKKIKSRNWTTTETNVFIEVLIDEVFRFGECFEKRAPKRSANKEVYQEILKVFTARLTEEEFAERNREHYSEKPFSINPYQPVNSLALKINDCFLYDASFYRKEFPNRLQNFLDY